MSAKHDDLVALRAFAIAVMECWPDGGIDGGELQDLAIEHGLLLGVTRYEPCSHDRCACADVYSLSDFDAGIQCYRRTDRLLGSGS